VQHHNTVLLIVFASGCAGNLKMLKYIFFALLFSVQAHADNTEQTLLCYEEKIESDVPCVLVAKTVKLENKSINNGTLYATNGGFYIEAPPGFVLIEHYYNGVLFEYSDKKRIGFVPVKWSYDLASLTKSYDEIYKIGRQDMQIFFYQHIGAFKDSYSALIIHKDMAEDKLYMIDSAGFTLAELKQVLATIRLIEPDWQCSDKTLLRCSIP